MKKAEFIRCCQEAIKTEESANQIYMKHLSAILLRTNIPEDDLCNARETLQHLISMNNNHKNIVEAVLERIRKEDIDVY
jgi:rubrerythrin